MAQTPDSKSAKVNNAAKDDIVHVSADGSFTLASLMANDPGSAKFYSYQHVQGLHFNSSTGLFTMDQTFDPSKGFDYTVQIGNGTYSTAHVSFDAHTHWEVTSSTTAEHLLNWSFEEGQTTSNGDYASFGQLPSWTNVGGTSLEVVSDGYHGIGTAGDGGHWLDTKASPGGVDISQTVSGMVAGGDPATLSIRVAVENLTDLGRSTDPDAHLQVFFNGTKVMDFTRADLDQAGPENVFQAHSVDVSALVQNGNNTVEIKDVGTTTGEGYVGFALDSVSLATTHTEGHFTV